MSTATPRLGGSGTWMAGAAGIVLLMVLVTACGGSPPPDARVSETIWCADENGVLDMVSWQGHDGKLTAPAVAIVPLDRTQQISEDDLAAACSPRPPQTEYTVCEAYAPAHAARQIAERGATSIHGEFSDSRAGVATVIRGEVHCEDLTLDPPQGIDRLRAWNSGLFNTSRQVDRDLSAAAQDCLDLDTARTLALQARDTLKATAHDNAGGDWPVVEKPAEGCHEVHLTRLGYIAVEDPHGSPTLPTD